MRRLPPLTALPAFEATARHKSVVAAARELRRSDGSVSRQIHSLSDALGVTLFEASGQRVKLTKAGAILLPHVHDALDALQKGVEAAGVLGTAQPLTVGIGAGYASRWLEPRLPAFRARHPEVPISIKTASGMAIDSTGYDLIITWDRLRFDPRDRADYVSLGDVAFGMVHAPGYLDVYDPMRCKVKTRLVVEANPSAWTAWQSLSGVAVSVEQSRGCSSNRAAIEFAIRGEGAAVCERRLVAEDVAEGRLVAPYDFTPIRRGLGAFVRDRGKRNSSLRTFLDWLREAA